MSSNDTSVNSGRTILNIALARQITYWFLIILIIPSVAGSCFVFYRVTQRREIFKRLSNQLIFCLFTVYFIQVNNFYQYYLLNILFIQATLDLPLTIAFLHRDKVLIPNYTFCAYWFILISTLDMCTMHLNAYLSIERYLLVFHNKFLLK
jgi:hypothetical protein